jgi:hypothetical protein
MACKKAHPAGSYVEFCEADDPTLWNNPTALTGIVMDWHIQKTDKQRLREMTLAMVWHSQKERGNQFMFNLTTEIMKKILLAVCLTFGGASLVVAQDVPGQTPTQTQTTQDQDQDKDKQQISVSELPESVTAKLCL